MTKNISNKLYDYIYDFGMYKNKNLIEISKEIGISYSTINKLKTNTAIRRSTLFKISQYTGTPIEQLYEMNQLYELPKNL